MHIFCEFFGYSSFSYENHCTPKTSWHDFNAWIPKYLAKTPNLAIFLLRSKDGRAERCQREFAQACQRIFPEQNTPKLVYLLSKTFKVDKQRSFYSAGSLLPFHLILFCVKQVHPWSSWVCFKKCGECLVKKLWNVNCRCDLGQH